MNNCSTCALAATRKNIVISRGSENPRILFIGEAPGAREDETGKPFMGRAGKVLDSWILALNLFPDEYAITNIVRCRPPGNRRLAKQEIANCLSQLQEYININKPKLIIALGSTAFSTLTGSKNPILSEVGNVHETKYGKVIAMIHPAYAIYNRNYQVPLGTIYKLCQS